MNAVVNLALSQGYLLKTAAIQNETVYWVENPYFTSLPYLCLEDLASFLHTLPLLPHPEDTLIWLNLAKALSPQLVAGDRASDAKPKPSFDVLKTSDFEQSNNRASKMQSLIP